MPIDPKRILYKDDHFLAVHKLNGELSVKGKGAVGKLPLYDFLRKEFPGIRPINRLDFDTSGVMIFARTKEALASVMPDPDREEDPGWKKTYRTFVSGHVPKDVGEIHFPLPARTGHKLIPAHTSYKVLERFPGCTYVETEITTGRHHQIRRHFAKIGCPLVLDDLYGNKDYNRGFSKVHKYRKFFLHAYVVEFVHPFTKEKVRIESPMPLAFEALLKRLRARA